MNAKASLHASSFGVEPRLTVRLGVISRGGDAATVSRTALGDTLALVKADLDAFQTADSRAGDARRYSVFSSADFRLVSPMAEPATLAAAAEARDLGLPVEAILHHATDRHRAALSPADAATFDALAPGMAATLALDTIAPGNEAAARSLAERSIVAHSDAVMCLEGGDEPATAGSDAVLNEARRSGMLVLSLAGDGRVTVWQPDRTSVDPGVEGTWQPVLADDPDCPGRRHLHAGLARLLGLPTDPQSAPPRAGPAPHRTAGQRLKDRLGTWWRRTWGGGHGPSRAEDECLADYYDEDARTHAYHCGYETLRWLFAESRWPRLSPRVDYRLDANQEAEWAETRAFIARHYDAGFADAFERVLRQRWIFADNLAVHYANRYRSAYISNFALSGLAVLIGLIAVFWTEPELSKSVKVIAVLLELGCIGLILRTFAAERRGGWHQRYLHYRSLAEALRPSRLPALLGNVSSRLAVTPAMDPSASWVAWYVRATFREVPLPSGRLDTAALREVLTLATGEEIGEPAKAGAPGTGQIGYHARNAARSSKLDHSLHRWASWLLYGTILSGLVYVAFYGLYAGEEGKGKVWKPWVEFYKPVATFLGGVLPTFGAVMFGVRAVGDFRASAHQSQRMVAQLTPLCELIVSERDKDHPSLDRAQQMLARLTQVLADDQRIWAMIYSEREVTPGF